LPDAPRGAVRLALHDERVDASDPLLFHKTTLRGRYEAARAAHPEAGEVIFRNERGELTEGSISNLVIQKGGVRLTPPLGAGLLPGVFRAYLLDRGEIREETLYPEDLEGAEGIWLINALRGWRPAFWPGK
jgi:para-aminobenzoate synthetase/4-amino-4-deoxychorismate lyase